jgi:rod shape-determining protein MreD
MRNTIIKIFVIGVLAMLHASFFSAFGTPVSLVNLPLIFIVYMSSGLRLVPAVGMAFVAGLVTDSISVASGGTHIISYMIVAAVFTLLFSTVLTHLSLVSVIGANAGAFMLFHLVMYAMRGFGRVVSGQAFITSGSKDAILILILAVFLQVVVCVIVRLVRTWLPGGAPKYMILR